MEKESGSRLYAAEGLNSRVAVARSKRAKQYLWSTVINGFLGGFREALRVSTNHQAVIHFHRHHGHITESQCSP